MEFEIKLKDERMLNTVMNALSNLPYNQVQPVIHYIMLQVEQQQKEHTLKQESKEAQEKTSS